MADTALTKPGKARQGTASDSSAESSGASGAPGKAGQPDRDAIGPRGSLAKDTFLTLTAQAIGLICGAGTSIITARMLGPDGRGVLAIVLLAAGLVGLTLRLSAEYGFTYRVSHRLASLGSTLTASLVMAAIVGSVGLALLWLATGVLGDSVLLGVPRAVMMIAGLGIGFGAFSGLAGGAILGAGWIRERTILSIAGSFTGLALMMLLVLALRMDLMGAVLAGVLSSAITASFVLLWLGRRVGMPRRVDSRLIGSSATLGLRMHPGMIAQWANYSVDRFIVNYFLGASAVGLYVVAAGLGELMWQIPGAMGVALFPRAASSSRATADMAARACRQALVLVGGACLVVAAAAPALVPALYGRPFAAAVPALLVLLPGVVAVTATKMLNPYLVARGHPSATTHAGLTGLLTTVALDLWLIPRWGIVGAAAASSAAYFVTSSVIVAWFMRVSGIGLGTAVVPRQQDASSLRVVLHETGQRVREFVRRGAR